MMEATDITKELKGYALSLGVDMVGIADLEKVPDYSPPRSPEDVLKGSKYAIVYGQKMLWGSIDTTNYRIATAHTMAMYDNFHLLSQQIGRWLENRGYRAAVLNHYLPLEMSRERKGLSGDLSLRHLAVTAGFGNLGKSRLVLTEKYGPRVRFAAVLTDGDLVPDEPKPVTKDWCAGCDMCIRHCPQEAIKEGGVVDIFACLERSRQFGLFHFNRFIKKILANVQPQQGEGISAKDIIMGAIRDPYWWNLYQELEIGIFYGCFDCLTYCPAGEDYAIFKCPSNGTRFKQG